MKNCSKMNKVEFVINIAWKYILGFICYRSLLFRAIPDLGVFESLMLLRIMVLISAIFFIIVVRHRKNEWTASASVILPFGLYTVLTYAASFALFIRVVISVSVLLSIAYAFIHLKRRIKHRSADARSRVIRNRIMRCIYTASCIMTAAMSVLMVGIGWRGYFGSGQIPSSVKAEGIQNDIRDEDTMEANKAAVLKLWPSEWENLSTHERIDVLQTVCNIETHYLGLSDPISVQGDKLSPYTLGVYSDTQKVILINLDHIENNHVEDVLSTLLHEIHHCYEWRLAEACDTIPSEYRDLRLFKDAAHYSQEINHYTDPRKDYWEYMSQHLEMDCETYAELGVGEYYTRIEKWMEERTDSMEASD